MLRNLHSPRCGNLDESPPKAPIYHSISFPPSTHAFILCTRKNGLRCHYLNTNIFPQRACIYIYKRAGPVSSRVESSRVNSRDRLGAEGASLQMVSEIGIFFSEPVRTVHVSSSTLLVGTRAWSSSQQLQQPFTRGSPSAISYS